MIARRSILGLLAGLPFVGKAVAEPVKTGTFYKVDPPVVFRRWDGPLFAREGEWVTCENHHTICMAAKDIVVGQLPAEDDFTNWLQPKPKFGTPADETRCRHCGGRWFSGDNGQHLHFSDGWR